MLALSGIWSIGKTVVILPGWLYRWDASQPATVDNVVMLTCAEAEAHEETSLDTLKQGDPDFVRAVEAVLQHVRKAYGLDSFVENPLYETYSGVGLL